MNVGPIEIVVVLVLALLVFGPSRLPQMGKQLGRGLREFKKAADTARTELGLDDVTAEINSVKASVSDLKSSVDLKSAIEAPVKDAAAPAAAGSAAAAAGAELASAPVDGEAPAAPEAADEAPSPAGTDVAASADVTAAGAAGTSVAAAAAATPAAAGDGDEATPDAPALTEALVVPDASAEADGGATDDLTDAAPGS